MTERQHSDKGSIPTDSWLEMSIHLFRYGFSIIRRDGWRFFFKRLSQLTTWQVKRLYLLLRIKPSGYGNSRLIKVEDVDPSARIALLDPETLPSPGITNSDHDQLVLQSLALRRQQSNERDRIVQQGRLLFSNRKVLIVSPIRVLGGGANLIFLATKAMRRMGVDAQILNLKVNRSWFEKNYKDLALPVIFTDVEDIPRLVENFDAVIATSNPTVAWVAPAAAQPDLVMGYYIQDYEPYFYPQGTHEFKKAFASYTLIPNLVRMVTTPWIAEQIELNHHLHSTVVGGHFDLDLFQPRPRSDPSWPERPLRITAMIRPTTPRRNPELTMAVLQQVDKKFQSRVQIRLFGCEPTDPGFASLEQKFRWQLAGQLRSTQVANLFNEADIFVDFSEFQAFGLTSLEAMGCGLAVIAPAKGGANVYARHEENCLVVDTGSQSACFDSLCRLLEDKPLRHKLQTNAISTAIRFFTESPALNMLNALYPEDK